MKFKVVLLQILPEDNQEKNLVKGLEYCRKAKELGADLVLFPELWNIGFASCPLDKEGKEKWEDSAIDQQREFFQSFVKLARELELNIALSYLEKYSPKPKNSVSIIDKNGGVALNYSKVFICNFGLDELTKENPNFDDIGCDYNCTPGNTFEVCTLQGKEGGVKVGVMICADREFPEPATQLMLNGAEIIVVPNACEFDEIRKALLKARAFENLLGIAVANYPAPKDNGHSMAVHPAAWDEKDDLQDTLIIEAGGEEGIFLAEFDMDQIRNFRKMESWRLDYRKNWHTREKV